MVRSSRWLRSKDGLRHVDRAPHQPRARQVDPLPRLADLATLGVEAHRGQLVRRQLLAEVDGQSPRSAVERPHQAAVETQLEARDAVRRRMNLCPPGWYLLTTPTRPPGASLALGDA